jgi:transcriptional regulator with XRE-family HTH domain
MSRMLGEAIARDRNKLKISQSMLGQMMRVSQQMVAAWESGTSLPKGPRLRLLLDILGTEGDTFKTVDIIRKIDPTIFEIPDQMLRGSDRAGALSQVESLDQVGALSEAGVEHPFLRAVQARKATQNARRFATMSSANTGRNLQIEFIRATEQILAATKALAKVSADLAEATRMLGELGPKIEALTPEVNFERPEPEDPSRD